MSVTAVYDRTIYYNEQNKYCVICVKTNDQSVPKEARGRSQGDRQIRFTAVGYELPRTDKVSMVLEGEWQSGKYGLQLKVSSFEEIVPQTRDGVQGYLASRLVKGVGAKTAALIVDRFGADALYILENEPERLLEIKGITVNKLEDIKTSYSESHSLRDLMVLLSPYHVTPVTATKIYEYFGAKSVDILKDDPYALCRISGFGFKRVDAIVMKGKCRPNDPTRIQGALKAALDTQRSDNGHLFLEREELMKTATRLLNERIPLPQMRVNTEEIATQLETMILRGEVVCNNDRIYLLDSFAQEDETARRIAELLQAAPERVDITQALSFVRNGLGITLSQRQSEAVCMAFRSNLSIITGSPGTGKTTVLRAIIEVFKQYMPKGKVLLAAPTGRASRRMTESTGRQDAMTLHSLLGLQGEDTHMSCTQPLEADLIIVDETSMVDMWLARQFFSRVRPGTKVVLVGDVDQLQSVGAGDVFRELIACGQIPVTVLNEIFRQHKGSRIAYNAKQINEDQTTLQYGEDFRFIKCKTQDEAAMQICEVFQEEVKEFGIAHVQILSPFRADGAAAADPLNSTIREMINPPKDPLPDLLAGRRFFRVGDKVMQTKNNDKASNGDIGFICAIESKDNKPIVTIAFSDDRTVQYGLEDMEHMDLAYATTIHKAMGSEFRVVIIPLIRSHALMLTRNLLYTAITRAKSKVILVGQMGMLMMAIHRNDTGKRNTLLGERIGKYCKVLSLQQPLRAAS